MRREGRSGNNCARFRRAEEVCIATCKDEEQITSEPRIQLRQIPARGVKPLQRREPSPPSSYAKATEDRAAGRPSFGGQASLKAKREQAPALQRAA